VLVTVPAVVFTIRMFPAFEPSLSSDVLPAVIFWAWTEAALGHGAHGTAPPGAKDVALRSA
jgi:hypothetical protein